MAQRKASYGRSFTLSFEVRKNTKDLNELQDSPITDPEEEHDWTISRVMDAVDQERIGKFTTRAGTPTVSMDVFEIPMEVTSNQDFTDKEFWSALDVLEAKVQKEVRAIRDNTEFGAWMFLPRQVPVIFDVN